MLCGATWLFGAKVSPSCLFIVRFELKITEESLQFMMTLVVQLFRTPYKT